LRWIGLGKNITIKNKVENEKKQKNFLQSYRLSSKFILFPALKKIGCKVTYAILCSPIFVAKILKLHFFKNSVSIKCAKN